MVFWLVSDSLDFSSVVLLTPPIFVSVLVFFFHSTFRLFQHPEWEVPGVIWLLLSVLPVGYVVFLRSIIGFI